VLLRQSQPVGRLSYAGAQNGYYNLDAYWAVGEQVECADWREFRERLAREGGRDGSRELRAAPWLEADPLALLERQDVARAFRPDPLQADLRLRRKPGDRGEVVLGVGQVAGTDYVKDLPPLDTGNAGGRTLVVQPGRHDPDAGVYRSLEHAVPDLRPGDVVLIRHDGELRLDPVVLARKELGDVTVRPDRGYRPVLTLTEAAGGEADAALFRVHDGRLTLEDLEIRLRPARDEVEAQAVVALAGDGQCALKHCVITLDRAGRKAALAVATLPDAGRGKMMDVGMAPARPREQGPHLLLERCLVRGEGDLLWARGSRASELEVRGSLVVLTGSLVNVEAAREAPAAGEMVATLERVTTCLAGNLLRVRAGKDLKGLAPVSCRATGCLFVPAGTPGDRVLVHLEGPEGEESALRGKVRWSGGANAYGGFNALLDFQAPEEGKMAQPMTLDRWKEFSGDGDGAYANVGLAAAPAAPSPQAQPADFRPGDKVPADCGADVAALPRPRGEAARFPVGG
jgi:hypothetical protein